MKYLSLFVIGLFLSSCGGFIPNEIQNGKVLGVMPLQYGRVSYQTSNRLPSEREDIFRQARRWAAFHVGNPSHALAISDNLIGDIIATGRIDKQYIKTRSGPQLIPALDYAASIECYDRYYRVTLTNFRYDLGPQGSYGVELRPKGMNKNRVKQQLEIIHEQVNQIINSLQEFIDAEAKRTQ
ncbi:DUF4468 domain-containing protein [Spirosoma sp. SC4-14]|uniref:DUF4468 domain-containing protein n=1 Tax=Spirosoma sp. SC4-14 TaxID=3128900 RepID=UPI0030CC1A8F